MMEECDVHINLFNIFYIVIGSNLGTVSGVEWSYQSESFNHLQCQLNRIFASQCQFLL